MSQNNFPNSSEKEKRRTVHHVTFNGMLVFDEGMDPSPFQLEAEVESALRSVTGVTAYSTLEFTAENIGDQAFVCPICGGLLKANIEMKGTYDSPIDPASGYANDGKFNGTAKPTYECTIDASHDLGEVIPLIDAINNSTDSL